MRTISITTLGQWYWNWTIQLWGTFLTLFILHIVFGTLASKNKVQQNLIDHTHVENYRTNNAERALRLLIGSAFPQLITYSHILYTWRWASTRSTVASCLVHIPHALALVPVILSLTSSWLTSLIRCEINYELYPAATISELAFLTFTAYIMVLCITVMPINVLLCDYSHADDPVSPPLFGYDGRNGLYFQIRQPQTHTPND